MDQVGIPVRFQVAPFRQAVASVYCSIKNVISINIALESLICTACPCMVKDALLMALAWCRHLHLSSSFEGAMRDILKRGGDVDTNAAIVGGMMGALHGASGIPASMRLPVLARTSKSPGKRVPEYLCASKVPELAKRLHSVGEVPLTG